MASGSSRIVFRQVRTLVNVSQRTLTRNIARHFSADAAAENDIVKEIFSKQQTQFRSYLKELEKVKIPLGAESEKEIKDYATSLRNIEKKLGIPSYTEKISNLLESAAEDAQDVRSFLNDSRKLREDLGIEDIGVEPLYFEALDSLEAKFGKPLSTSDPKAMSAWEEQMKVINQKLGLDESQLESLEEEVELGRVKLEIAHMTEATRSYMEMVKKRDGYESVSVDIKNVDPRPYI